MGGELSRQALWCRPGPLRATPGRPQTAPTAFRAIRKEDPNGELLAKYDLSKFRNWDRVGLSSSGLMERMGLAWESMVGFSTEMVLPKVQGIGSTLSIISIISSDLRYLR